MNRHISATVWHIAMKFGMVPQSDLVNTTWSQKFEHLQNQDGGRPPS